MRARRSGRHGVWLASLLLGAACAREGPAEGTCRVNQDCPTDARCVAGQCLVASPGRCQSDASCGPTEFCDVVEAVCKSRAGCVTNAQCGPEEICSPGSGTCVPGRRSCNDDSACTPIQKRCDLDLQQCVDCLDDTHCSDPEICLKGVCVESSGPCADDGQCTVPDTVCESGQCIPGCGEAGSPLTCTAGFICDPQTGRCRANQLSCIQDTNCGPPAAICESGQCVAGCGQLGGVPCTGGFLCNPARGRCEASASCTVDANCQPPGSVCEGGSCVAGCGQFNGLSCSEGTVCDTRSGRCVAISGPCSSDADCRPPTTVCESNQCVGGCTEVAGLQCTGNTVCNPASGRCDPGGPVCMGDQDCNPPDTICNLATGGCDPGCTVSGCTGDDTCNAASGRCDPPVVVPGPIALPLNSVCSTNADCESSVCHNFGSPGRRCVQSCASHTDCPSGYTCFDSFGAKVCASNQIFGNATFAAPTGSLCIGGADCQSNFCTESGGLRQCISQCSDDRDCAPGDVCQWYEYSSNLFIAACNGPRGAIEDGGICGTSSECASGVCYTPGLCGGLCGRSEDCLNGSICFPLNYSVCTFRFIACFSWVANFVSACVEDNHGPDPNGTPCVNAAGDNCRGGFCHSGSGLCTGACSRNADCPAGWVCGVEPFGDLDGDTIYINLCRPT